MKRRATCWEMSCEPSVRFLLSEPLTALHGDSSREMNTFRCGTSICCGLIHSPSEHWRLDGDEVQCVTRWRQNVIVSGRICRRISWMSCARVEDTAFVDWSDRAPSVFGMPWRHSVVSSVVRRLIGQHQSPIIIIIIISVVITVTWLITSHWRGRGDLYTQTKQQYLQLHTIHGDPETYRFDSLPMNDNNWAHSMGPQRSPLSRVVVVVVDIDAQAARDSTASDI